MGQFILMTMAILLLLGVLMVPQILFKLEQWSMRFPEDKKKK